MTVDPAAVSAASGTQGTAAAAVAEHAAAERLDTASLAPAFGLIGAGFLVALAEVTAVRARRLESIAIAHGATARGATAAGAAYDCCDDSGARAVAV